MSIQISRINSLRNIISENQALLITDDTNIFYYSDFYKSEGAFLVTKEQAYLFVDFRYYEAARSKAKGCEVICFKNLINSLVEVLKKQNIKSLLLESEKITVSLYSKYLKAFNEIGVSLDTTGSLDKVIKNQRMIKSECEIGFIEKAQIITEKAYLDVLNFVKPGVSERKIAIELEYLMKKYGAEDISFDLITITGKKTSLPHGVPGEETICSGDFFTMDIGAIFNGYHSDMTRTVAVKCYTEEMAEIYNIVLNAHLKALNFVKSGIKANEIDKIARDIITDAGYGECFGHSTGHGVGLDIHEAPNVSPNSDIILSDNMVITIEPGIYIENKFGVRIEDMVLVKKDGFQSFATIEKQLIVV